MVPDARSPVMTRRSTRLRAQIPILITSLDPTVTLALFCETVVVNAHGCAARVHQSLTNGMPVRLQVGDSEATGRVAVCTPMGDSQADWLVGIELDQPENIWGLKTVPKDWAPFAGSAPQSRPHEPAAVAAPPSKAEWPLGSSSRGTALVARTAAQEELDTKLGRQQEVIDSLQDRLASLEATTQVIQNGPANEQQIIAQIRRQVDASLAELARPLQEEVALCRKDAQQIQLDIIRLEKLPEQIAQRVEAGFQALLEQARAEFLQERVRDPVALAVQDALVQARTELSAEVARALETLNAEMSRRLEQLTNDLESRTAERLEQRLKATEVEIQTARAEEFNQSLAPMVDRITDLRQQALSSLDTVQQETERCQAQLRTFREQRDEAEAWIVERTGNFRKEIQDTVLETSGQIKGRIQMAVELACQPVQKIRDETTRQMQEQAAMQARLFREKLDETGERLASLQRDIEGAVAESLRAQVAQTSAVFQREIGRIAQCVVEEWRSALAKNLQSLTYGLGQKLVGGDQ